MQAVKPGFDSGFAMRSQCMCESQSRRIKQAQHDRHARICLTVQLCYTYGSSVGSDAMVLPRSDSSFSADRDLKIIGGEAL